MKSLDDLKELKEQSFNKIELRLDNRKYKLVVHYFDKDETSCKNLVNYLFNKVEEESLNCYVILGESLNTDSQAISVVEKDNSTTYGNITKEIADEILNSHIQNDIVLEKYIAK